MTVKALRRQLMAAIAMVVVSVVALSSSTYAWFAANTQVTAEGMSVQAQAENGIVITNANGTDWKSTANAVTASATLFPTSTRDANTWYHNVSDDAGSSKSSQEASSYTDLTSNLVVSNSTYGVGYIDKDSDSTYTPGTDDGYYLLNTFKIKSSSADMTGITLYINKVEVTTSTSSSTALNGSLRVAIVVGGQTYIYAPVNGATTTYKVGGSETEDFTPYTTLTGKNLSTTVTSISATDASATPVSIYCFYEGEDANCKSSNITGITPDSLSVTVQFGITPIS